MCVKTSKRERKVAGWQWPAVWLWLRQLPGNIIIYTEPEIGTGSDSSGSQFYRSRRLRRLAIESSVARGPVVKVSVAFKTRIWVRQRPQNREFLGGLLFWKTIFMIKCI